MTRSRMLLLGGGAMAVLVLAVAIWAGRQAATYAAIGGTYVAKQFCSCLFVAERSESSCRAEFQPDIGKFKVTVERANLPAEATVTTRLLMFEGQARYAQGYGCTVSK